MLRFSACLLFALLLTACGGTAEKPTPYAPVPTWTPTPAATPTAVPVLAFTPTPTAAVATPSVWTDAEIAYIDALAPLQLLPGAAVKALPPSGVGGVQAPLIEVLTQLDGRPKAPATLLVVEGHVIRIQQACDNSRLDLGVTYIEECAAQINSVADVLLALYAERGAYPHQ